jgi:hypothetical protein
MRRGSLSALLVALTILMPTRGLAQDPEPAAEERDPALEEAKRLFADGAGKFETADYEGAIADWTQAYSIVPNRPDYAQIKAKLIANIASARERAYGVDEEVAHLNQAKILLESYREAIRDIYPSELDREKEQAWVEDRLGKIETELAAAAERAKTKAEPKDETPAHPGRAALVAGAVLTGLGGGALGMMGAGLGIGAGANDIGDLDSDDLAAREARFDRGRLGNALGIAGGVGGAVLLGAGVALLVVGLKQKRRAGTEAVPARARVWPLVSPRVAGLGLSGRF